VRIDKKNSELHFSKTDNEWVLISGWSVAWGNGLKAVRAFSHATMKDTDLGRSRVKPPLAISTIAVLGIVFGDIGTSPLYAFRECFSGKHGAPIQLPPGRVVELGAQLTL